VLSPRVAVAERELRMLVLAPSSSECTGVDLATGALVRAQLPAGSGSSPLSPYDIARGRVVPDVLDDLAPPESLSVAEPLSAVGRLTGRRAERYLRPLLHPRRRPLLGFTGPAIRYWDLDGRRPTVSLVTPAAGPDLVVRGDEMRCRFGWDRHVHELPLDPPPAELGQLRKGKLRLVVALAPPRDGYCYKTVVSILPPP
jgi:hypothetical protein